MVEKRYPYKPATGKFLVVLALIGGMGYFMFHIGKGNEQGLIINGIIEFSLNGATYLYFGLAALFLGFELLLVYMMIKGSVNKREVLIGDQSISFPKSGISNKIITLAYTDIKGLGIISIQSNRYIKFEHSGGECHIPEILLPGKEAAEEIVEILSKKLDAL